MKKIFISYARKDGAELAQRLQSDLKARGYDAWLDKQRIKGGASWTTDIETAIDEAKFVLALLTPGSYVSEICRAEQLRSLRKGKVVIPLKAHRDTDIPLHLEQKNYRDFSAANAYSEHFAELLKDIVEDRGITLSEKYRQTYVTAPPLPVNFVKRPEALAALRDALITDGGGRHIALTALRGMGGLGKTILAQALCHDEVVQQAFPDGVVWVTVGKESTFDVVTRLREVGKALDDDLSRYDNELGCRNQYRSTIRSKAALIVIDDVWKAADIEPFRAESPRSRLLFTTRNAEIGAAVGAQEHTAGLLTKEESREVLARWSGTEVLKLPPEATRLVQECDRLPLALAMVGAMLRGKPPLLWKRLCNLLRQADLEKIKADFPDYPHTSLFRAIQVSVESLDEPTRQRYLDLAVMLEDMPIPPVVQQSLWHANQGEALEIAEQFLGRSLAQRDGEAEAIRLHDLQLDYVRAQYLDRGALSLIHGALRLSSHIIARDPSQFASQMVGRLLPHANHSVIKSFAAGLAEYAPRPWLRPLHAALTPPGGSLLRTLQGHSYPVWGLAVRADGRLAISASDDNTLKVWDLDSGHELLTLQGHSDRVNGVAISADGRLAVSASSDNTLKVWDLVSGRELFSLQGHSDSVRGVAMSADGRLAVSASGDKTLKLWDVNKGRELRSLQGHSGWVVRVAVSADGRLAVSASSDATLKVWELDSGRQLRSLQGHLGPVRGVAISADGRLAVSASTDCTLMLWDLISGRQLRSLRGHSRPVNSVAVSADGRLAVSASDDNTLKLWDLVSGRQLHSMQDHSRWVMDVAMSADGRLAVSASADNTLKLWDLVSGREPNTLQSHSGWVNSVAVSADGRLAVSASDDNTLKVWDLVSGREPHALQGHADMVNGVAVSADGRLAVSASADKTLKLWDLASSHEPHTLQGHSDVVNGVAVSADGQLAVTACADKTLKLWDLVSGRQLRSLQGHSGLVDGVAVSADGRLAVSASADKTLKLWDLASGLQLCSLLGHTDRVFGVSVSADGQLAVSASADKTLKVWDMESGRELRSLLGHSDWVWSVALSADGRLAVSASRDNTLKVWGLDNGQAVATFTCEGPATCCAWVSSNGILAGDAGGRVYFLELIL
ncbi:MAG: TIR domain-containing protein [Acidobacteriia bacterium]|nr:TIR domain-containing protein [Terriglobia bacterium]